MNQTRRDLEGGEIPGNIRDVVPLSNIRSSLANLHSLKYTYISYEGVSVESETPDSWEYLDVDQKLVSMEGNPKTSCRKHRNVVSHPQVLDQHSNGPSSVFGSAFKACGYLS